MPSIYLEEEEMVVHSACIVLDGFADVLGDGVSAHNRHHLLHGEHLHYISSSGQQVAKTVVSSVRSHEDFETTVSVAQTKVAGWQLCLNQHPYVSSHQALAGLLCLNSNDMCIPGGLGKA